MICEKCGKEFFNDIRKKGVGTPRFCSIPCARSRTWTEADKQKKSEALKNSEAHKKVSQELHDRATLERFCVVCGTPFLTTKSAKRQTCGDACKRTLQAIKGAQYAAEHGPKFQDVRQSFEYKSVKIDCDSALEEAGVIYLLDVLHVDYIERYKNFLNYWNDTGLHKVYNPDFYAKKGDQVYIVEVKMRWSATSTHIYNQQIPKKKEILARYCKDNNFIPVWLDFDYDPVFHKIYREHLKVKTGRTHFSGLKPE